MTQDKLPAPTGEGTEPSKKALKKQQKEAEKAAKKAERKAQTVLEDVCEDEDVSVGSYGQLPLIQSSESFAERRFVDVKNLDVKLANEVVWLRGRLHTSRAKGKQCFFVLRQQSYTVQGLAAVNETTSKQMIKFVSNVTKESIIDVEATIKCVPSRIEACTQKDVELHVERIYVVSASKPQLPLQIEDAARPVSDNDDSGLNIKVNQDTRLDNRILDLRTPANQAIFRVEAAVCKVFRDILTEKVGCLYPCGKYPHETPHESYIEVRMKFYVRTPIRDFM